MLIDNKYGIDKNNYFSYCFLMDRTGRKPRIHIPNSIHHVMVRGNNRQCIFFNNDHFHYFLKVLIECAEKFDHKIIAYCLMNNHAHLVVHIVNSPLSSVMQKINYRYARWVNHQEKRVGHLFQGRYRSLIVNNDEYFVNLCRYIHCNPVAANIVHHLDDYLWSSHQYYVKKNYPTWMNIDCMLLAIKNKTNLNYLDFINQPIDRDAWKPAIYLSESGDIVHNPDSLRLLEKAESQPRQYPRQFLSESEISTIVCDKLQCQKTQLYGPSRNHEIAKQRILLANYLIQFSNNNMTSVATLFNRTHGTLSRQLTQFSQHPTQYFKAELLTDIEQLLTTRIIEKKL